MWSLIGRYVGDDLFAAERSSHTCALANDGPARGGIVDRAIRRGRSFGLTVHSVTNGTDLYSEQRHDSSPVCRQLP